MNQAGSDRYSRFGRHVACHPLEQMMTALTLAADGVLERFPALKVVQLESGCGWLPYWLERMDDTGSTTAWTGRARRKRH